MDVIGAFLHSLLNSEIYMEPPEGFYQKGLIFYKATDAVSRTMRKTLLS
jgi:hypothetical protein